LHDFVIRFELKAGVEAIMNVFNSAYKYNHLYNSETIYWNRDVSLKLGGWLTNNFMTANWVYGKNINTHSVNIFSRKCETILLTDQHFFDIDKHQKDESEFSRMKFIDQYIVGFKNGYNKTYDLKAKFFENLILANNM
jgi:hypothetical protein